jgi:hypothetical protein
VNNSQDTVPLEVLPLSSMNVMECMGLGYNFEIEVDDKVFVLHSPDIKEAKDWYRYLLNISREARVRFLFSRSFPRLSSLIRLFTFVIIFALVSIFFLFYLFTLCLYENIRKSQTILKSILKEC